MTRNGMIRPRQFGGTNPEARRRPRRGHKARFGTVGVIGLCVATWCLVWFNALPGHASGGHVSIRGFGNAASHSGSTADTTPLSSVDDELESASDEEDEEDEEEEEEDEDAVIEDEDEEESEDAASDNDGEAGEEGIDGDDDDDGDSVVPVGGLVVGRSRTAPPKVTEVSLTQFFSSTGQKVVNIATSGSFKYVLVKVSDRKNSALMVQGCSPTLGSKCKHPNAAKIVSDKVTPYGIKADVLGGGRITHHRLRNSKRDGLISIFGYSKTFSARDGLCEDCHMHACELIAAAFPNHLVRWSNSGYVEKDEYKIVDWVKCN